MTKIKIAFIDDATGESIAVTEMPTSDLPESFVVDTTLHIGNEEWSIVDAQPMTRDAYTKSKTLTLRLRRIELMALGDILYSLPSICDAIPCVEDQQLSGSEFALAEDDWRQFEFVSNELAPVVDEEIEKIRLIHENEAAEFGWQEIHVRANPELPLTCILTLADLADSLNAPCESVGVTFHGQRSQIANGYAFRTDDLTLYGVAPNGNVQTIALDQYADASPGAESINRLKTIAHDLRLDLVYWCRCVRVGPDDPFFVSLLADTN